MKAILEIAESIDVSEIRRAIKVAAIRADTVSSSLDKSKALQTLVTLLRYSDHLKFDNVIVESRTLPDSEGSNLLQDAITRSGIGYFGPMFDASKENKISSKATIISIFANNGFDIEPLSILDGTQLDMLLTKTMETGLIEPQSM